MIILTDNIPKKQHSTHTCISWKHLPCMESTLALSFILCSSTLNSKLVFHSYKAADSFSITAVSTTIVHSGSPAPL